MKETKCYCGHTTYCDCGPEINSFKHEVKVIPKEEILANRSNAYEFIDMETLEEAEKEFEKLLNGKGLPTKQLTEVAEHYFISGYEIAKERSYSEEEMKDAYIQGTLGLEYKKNFNESFYKWFEQFKK